MQNSLARKSLVAAVSALAAAAAITTGVGAGSADVNTAYPTQTGPACYGLSPYLIDAPNSSDLSTYQDPAISGRAVVRASVAWSLWPEYVVEDRGSWKNLDNGRTGTLAAQSEPVTRPFRDAVPHIHWDIASGVGRVVVNVTSTPHGPIPVPGAHCTATFTIH